MRSNRDPCIRIDCIEMFGSELLDAAASSPVRSPGCDMYEHLAGLVQQPELSTDSTAQNITITSFMRRAEVHWIFSASRTMCLPTEVPFLGVSLLDRVLVNTLVRRPALRLLSAACLSIAMKHCDDRRIQLSVLVSMSGKRISVSALIDMERRVLKLLNGRIRQSITAYEIACVMVHLQSNISDEQAKQTAWLLSVAAAERRYNEYSPSAVAAGALMLATSVDVTLSRELLDLCTMVNVDVDAADCVAMSLSEAVEIC